MSAKPSLFIGSSREALQFANALQTNLVNDAETTVWNQGVFPPTVSTLEQLAHNAQRCDFAALVLHPDDIVKSRGKKHPTVRDNVVFELGLFLGALGRDRVFGLIPSDAPTKLPSDWAGITTLGYESKRADGNDTAALGVACTHIRKALRKHGSRGIHEFEVNDSVGIREYMARWLSSPGRVAMLSRNLSWADDATIVKLLQRKASAGDLTLCLQDSVPLLNKLDGAKVYLYNKAAFTPKSRFTIVNFASAGARVAIGHTSGKKHVIREYDPDPGTAYHLAEDMINALVGLADRADGPSVAAKARTPLRRDARMKKAAAMARRTPAAKAAKPKAAKPKAQKAARPGRKKKAAR